MKNSIHIYKLIVGLLSWGLMGSLAPLNAQIYYGGTGAGYSDTRSLGTLGGVELDGLYQGGNGDGYAASFREGPLLGIDLSVLYTGGEGSGYSEERTLRSLEGISIAGMFKGGNGDGIDQFWIRSSLLSAIVFPVALTSFEAFPIQDYIQVRWSTASELNTAEFTVERSLNAQDFTSISSIPAAGTSTEPLVYEVTDPNPYPGHAFYRLKSRDFDGTTSYSQVREVYFANKVNHFISYYPNPNTGEVLSYRLSRMAASGSVILRITDLQGRLMLSQKIELKTPPLEGVIPLGKGFTEGAYLISVQGADFLESQLLLIQ